MTIDQTTDLINAYLFSSEFFEIEKMQDLKPKDWVDFIKTLHRYAAHYLIALSDFPAASGQYRTHDILRPKEYEYQGNTHCVRAEYYLENSAIVFLQTLFGDQEAKEYKNFIPILHQYQGGKNGGLQGLLASKYKNHPGMASFKKLFSFGSKPQDISRDMLTFSTEICKKIKAIKTKNDAYRVAAYAHCELNRIHPFPNGNGRVSRILMNCILSLSLSRCSLNPVNFKSFGITIGYDHTQYSEGKLEPFFKKMKKCSKKHKPSKNNEINDAMLHDHTMQTGYAKIAVKNKQFFCNDKVYDSKALEKMAKKCVKNKVYLIASYHYMHAADFSNDSNEASRLYKTAFKYRKKYFNTQDCTMITRPVGYDDRRTITRSFQSQYLSEVEEISDLVGYGQDKKQPILEVDSKRHVLNYSLFWFQKIASSDRRRLTVYLGSNNVGLPSNGGQEMLEQKQEQEQKEQKQGDNVSVQSSISG